jgi:hypothetical protein
MIFPPIGFLGSAENIAAPSTCATTFNGTKEDIRILVRTNFGFLVFYISAPVILSE